MTTAAVASARRGRIGAYARLAKLSFFDYYLSALVVWTLLEPGERTSARAPLTLFVLTFGWMGLVACCVAFDDVTGFREGSDQQAYQPDQANLRSLARKPLLDGSLTDVQAVRFGWAALVWGLAWLAAGAAIAPDPSWWAIALIPFIAFISAQYSYGLRFSYRYGQELVLFLSTGLVVLVPFALVTGRATGLTLLESYLFGLWSVLVSLYSNINDAPVDRAFGRRNLATTTSPRVYAVIVALISATEAGAIALTVGVGAAPWWLLLLLSPVVALRLRQLDAGLRKGAPLVARKFGGQAHRLGVVLLLAANLIAIT
jgi:1,4-dihydroxy-2-naphthoate polyprenyltransferase